MKLLRKKESLEKKLTQLERSVAKLWVLELLLSHEVRIGLLGDVLLAALGDGARVKNLIGEVGCEK
jgi:hypothetical protein